MVPSYEHKAFIPYKAVFADAPDPSRHAVVRARAVALEPTQLVLDREFEGASRIPFDYLVAATGTRLATPGTMQDDDKIPSVRELQLWQQRILSAPSVVVIGGGAVGVQLVCDLKEVYPEKEITLVHSREKLMPLYHEALSDLIKDRLRELDIGYVSFLFCLSVCPPIGFLVEPIPNTALFHLC